MNWKWIASFLACFFMVFGVAGEGKLYAQVFPYAAPKAPEFDTNGDVVSQSYENTPAPQSARSVERAPADESRVKPAVAPTRYGVPMAPEVAPRRHSSRRTRDYSEPTTTQAVASRQPAAPPQSYSQPYGPPSATPGPPGPAPVQGSMVPDCSNYPMMLARAGSKQELQSVARHFLTCLLQSGWNMDSARKHVISTIETVKAMRF